MRGGYTAAKGTCPLAQEAGAPTSREEFLFNSGPDNFHMQFGAFNMLRFAVAL
jgi:hypothetical protein